MEDSARVAWEQGAEAALRFLSPGDRGGDFNPEAALIQGASLSEASLGGFRVRCEWSAASDGCLQTSPSFPSDSSGAPRLLCGL
jgi:hypothetical protein